MSTNHDESDLVEQLRSAYSALEPTGREPDVAARALTSARGAKRRAAVTQSAVALALVGVVGTGAAQLRANLGPDRGSTPPVAVASKASSTTQHPAGASTSGSTADATIPGDPAAGLTPTPGPTLSAGVPTSTSTRPITGATATPGASVPPPRTATDRTFGGECFVPTASGGIFYSLNAINTMPAPAQLPKGLAYKYPFTTTPQIPAALLPCKTRGAVLGTWRSQHLQAALLPDWSVGADATKGGNPDDSSSIVIVSLDHYASADALTKALAAARSDMKGNVTANGGYYAGWREVASSAKTPGAVSVRLVEPGMASGKSVVAYKVMGRWLAQAWVEGVGGDEEATASGLLDTIVAKASAQGVKG